MSHVSYQSLSLVTAIEVLLRGIPWMTLTEKVVSRRKRGGRVEGDDIEGEDIECSMLQGAHETSCAANVMCSKRQLLLNHGTTVGADVTNVGGNLTSCTSLA
jgi:hypothetical protein